MLSDLRRRRVVLVLLWIAVLARGLFWVVQTEVPSPVDEGQHLAVIDHVATTGSWPVVGRDRVAPTVLELIRSNEAGPARHAPLPTDPAHDGWGPVAHQYQAHHPPVVPLLLAPVYVAADAADVGMVGRVHLLRVVLAVIASLAVPLAALLARELAPGRHGAQVGAAALVAAAQAVGANTVVIGNDGPVMVAAAAALWVGVRGLRRGASGAVPTGLVLGVAGLTKVTAVSTGLLLAIGAAALAARGHLAPSRALRWCATVAGVALAVTAPWVVWNLVTYGGALGSSAAFELLATPDAARSRSAEAAFQVIESARSFWEATLVPADVAVAYRGLWWALVAFAAVATVVGLVRRHEAWGWTALALCAFPAALVVQVLAAITATGGAPVAGGRLLLSALVPTAVAIAVASDRLLPRSGLAVTAAAAALVCVLEVPLLVAMTDRVYAPGMVADTAATAGHRVAGALHEGPADLAIRTDCPVTHLKLVVRPPAPEVLVGLDDEGLVELVLAGPPSERLGGVVRAVYRPDRPVSGRIDVTLPTGVFVAVDPEPSSQAETAVVGRQAAPVMAAHCTVPDALAVRYEQLRGTTNVRWPAHPTARRWGIAWAVVAVGGAAAAATVAFGEVRRPPVRRRR